MDYQQVSTVTCPVCSNTNPVDSNQCLRCGFDLTPIKNALIQAGKLPASYAQATTPRGNKPVIPDLPETSKANLGTLIATQLYMIRGMASQCDDLIAYFFQQLERHEIPNAAMSKGVLKADGQKRDYYFICKYLSEQNNVLKWINSQVLLDPDRDNPGFSLGTMAITIFASGNDLMVEWRNFTRPAITSGSMLRTIGKMYITLGLSLFSDHDGRDRELKDFEKQDNLVLQMGVRASLEEAIDFCGIAHHLVQNMTSGNKSNRLI